MVPRWEAIANAAVGVGGRELPGKPQNSGLFCLPLPLRIALYCEGSPREYRANAVPRLVIERSGRGLIVGLCPSDRILSRRRIRIGEERETAH